MNVSASAWKTELQNQRQYGQAMMRSDEEVQPFHRQVNEGNRYEGNRYEGHQYRQDNGGNVVQFPKRSFQRQENEPTYDGPRLTGHQAFLKALMRSGAVIRLVTSLGDEYTGTVKSFDDATISLRIECATPESPNAYQNRVFFKQQLIEFAPVIEGVTLS